MDLKNLTPEDVKSIMETAEGFFETCKIKYGDAAVHYDKNALDNAIERTDKVLTRIMKDAMVEGTTTLDLHKLQTGYILGFASKRNCVFVPPFDLSPYESEDPIIYDPNTEFIIRLLRVLVEAQCIAENTARIEANGRVTNKTENTKIENCFWKPTGYRIWRPNNIIKIDGEVQDFRSSLFRLISSLTDVDDDILESPFFVSLVYSVSISNFLQQAWSDCVVYGKVDKYYNENK